MRLNHPGTVHATANRMAHITSTSASTLRTDTNATKPKSAKHDASAREGSASANPIQNRPSAMAGMARRPTTKPPKTSRRALTPSVAARPAARASAVSRALIKESRAIRPLSGRPPTRQSAPKCMARLSNLPATVWWTLTAWGERPKMRAQWISAAAGLALAALAPSAALAEESPWSATLYAGPSSTKFVTQILDGEFDVNGGMVGLAVDRGLLELGSRVSRAAQAP